jgi:hypothetical protein
VIHPMLKLLSLRHKGIQVFPAPRRSVLSVPTTPFDSHPRATWADLCEGIFRRSGEDIFVSGFGSAFASAQARNAGATGTSAIVSNIT